MSMPDSPLLYTLTEEDYLNLWQYLSPEEIAQTFGERSASSRQIRRTYKRHGLSELRNHSEALLKGETKDWRSLEERREVIRKGKERESSEIVSQLWKKIESWESQWRM